jgi:hypothetical protein
MDTKSGHERIKQWTWGGYSLYNLSEPPFTDNRSLILRHELCDQIREYLLHEMLHYRDLISDNY